MGPSEGVADVRDEHIQQLGSGGPHQGVRLAIRARYSDRSPGGQE